jgi:hypothetical protein
VCVRASSPVLHEGRHLRCCDSESTDRTHACRSWRCSWMVSPGGDAMKRPRASIHARTYLLLATSFGEEANRAISVGAHNTEFVQSVSEEKKAEAQAAMHKANQALEVSWLVCAHTCQSWFRPWTHNGRPMSSCKMLHACIHALRMRASQLTRINAPRTSRSSAPRPSRSSPGSPHALQYSRGPAGQARGALPPRR